jgi:hypothetical protein
LARGGSVGRTARQSEARQIRRTDDSQVAEKDRLSGATPEPMSGGSAVGEDRLPRGVAPTAGPAALLSIRERVADLYHEAAETGYGRAQRRAYLQVLSLIDEAQVPAS